MKNYLRILFVGIAFSCVGGFFLNASANELRAGDMHVIDGKDYEILEDGITDSYGNIYEENVIGIQAHYDGYISYELDGAYKKVKGALVASDETSSNAEISVGIFADGEEVYSINRYTRQQPKQEFELDLSGVKTLDIKSSDASGSGGCWIYLVETSFEPGESDTVPYSRLQDTFVIDSQDYGAGDTLAEDSYGNLHDGYVVFQTYYGSYALYNLDGKYKNLKAAWAAGSDTGSDAVMNVSVYCDDKMVFSKQGITRQDAKTDMDIDVTGVKVLKIQTSADAGSSSQPLYLYDDFLY